MKIRWTSQWQLRCTTCDETRPLAQAGGMRISSAALHKYTVAWCRTCCRPRLTAVEPAPSTAPELTAPHDPATPSAPRDRELKAKA